MPKYNVIKDGFHDGVLYSPHGKRTVLTTDKPFSKEKMPSWVEPVKAVSADEKLTPAQKAAITKAKNKADADKAPLVDDEKVQVDFTKQDAVETL